MNQPADPTVALYAAINSEAERVRVWRPFSGIFGARPIATKRAEYRKRATDAAMEAAIKARFQRRMPSRFELENAVRLEFAKEPEDKVGSIFISILASIIVRLILDWLLKGKALTHERGETSGGH